MVLETTRHRAGAIEAPLLKRIRTTEERLDKLEGGVMLHFLIGTAICIWIAERVAHYWENGGNRGYCDDDDRRLEPSS